MRKSQNNFLDICKVLLAVMVVAIHTGLTVEAFGVDLLWPWLRIAVPLFFLMSSYFFFRKKSERPESRLWRFINRNVSLYLFWFVFWLPFIVIRRWPEWTGGAWWLVPLRIVRSIMFSNTFIASWYIPAVVFGVLVVVAFSRIMSMKLMLFLSAGVYGALCVRSSYFHLVSGMPIALAFVSWWEILFSVGYNSFPAALFWCVLGKVFAEHSDRFERFNLAGLVFCVLLSSVLLWGEWFLFSNPRGQGRSDCLLGLMPFVPILFALLLRVRIELSFAMQLRSLSVIIFCAHGFFTVLMKRLLCTMGVVDGNRFIAFFMVLGISACLWAIFSALERKGEKFSFLQFSH